MTITRTKLLAVCIAAIIISLTLIVVFSGTGATRVACIGDSITQFSTYPNDLQTMLGTSYHVREFGVSGSTVLINSFTPYIDQREFQKAKEFLPNIVIILLGTNDARADYYQSIANFVADYEQLVREVQALESKPKIFLVKPPPLFDNELDLSNANILEGVIPGIEQVAEELGLTTIDVYTPLADHPEYFVDGVHPSNEGASLIASEIYKAF
ncbi:hypothetical protein JXA31_02485 [Candidatus Bathyarchaeota archaeon]|nr:hypothetical protein [Candidatus Bathyarchaeota archaeon]